MLTAGRGAPSLWIVKRKFVTFHKNGGRRCNVFFLPRPFIALFRFFLLLLPGRSALRLESGADVTRLRWPRSAIS